MESVWLLLGGTRDIGPVDPFGFFWPRSFRYENPRSWVLDLHGFSRQNLYFQWITRLKAEKSFYSRFFSGVRSATTGACDPGHAEARIIPARNCCRGVFLFSDASIQKQRVLAPRPREAVGSAGKREGEAPIWTIVRIERCDNSAFSIR